MGDATVSQFVPRSNMGRIRIIAPEPWPAELQAFDGYLEAKNLPKSTRQMRNYQLRRFATDVAKAPYDVTFNDILENLASHGWGANTKAAARSALRSFYGWAKKTDRIRRNPAKSVEKVKIPAGVPHPVPDEIIEAVLAAAPAREALMIKLGAYLGLRAAEIACVRSSDVVRRVAGSGAVRYWLVVPHGKGDKFRQIPIQDETFALELAAHAGYLFRGQIHGHVSAGYVSKLVSRQLPSPHTCHGLRHRYATFLLRSGINVRVVQKLLGHASVATTMIYLDVDDDDLWGAVAA